MTKRRNRVGRAPLIGGYRHIRIFRTINGSEPGFRDGLRTRRATCRDEMVKERQMIWRSQRNACVTDAGADTARLIMCHDTSLVPPLQCKQTSAIRLFEPGR